MLAALAASAAPLVDADGFALEGTTTMLAAGRPGSVWMLRTVPLYDDMCVSTDGHGAFGGIAAAGQSFELISVASRRQAECLNCLRRHRGRKPDV